MRSVSSAVGVLWGIVILLAALAASSAGAATLKYGNPPATVPTGSTLQGTTTTGLTLTGTQLGAAQTVRCTSFTLSGSITSSTGTVSGAVSSAIVGNCSNITTGSGCTIIVGNMPWAWSLTTSTTGTNVGGTFSTAFTLTLGGCFFGVSSCTFQGAGSGNTVSGAWTGANLSTSAAATVAWTNAPVNVTSSLCGSGWTLSVTDTMSATVGGVAGQLLTLDNP